MLNRRGFLATLPSFLIPPPFRRFELDTKAAVVLGAGTRRDRDGTLYADSSKVGFREGQGFFELPHETVRWVLDARGQRGRTAFASGADYLFGRGKRKFRISTVPHSDEVAVVFLGGGPRVSFFFPEIWAVVDGDRGFPGLRVV